MTSMGASAEGAEMITFLAPPFMCWEACAWCAHHTSPTFLTPSAETIKDMQVSDGPHMEMAVRQPITECLEQG